MHTCRLRREEGRTANRGIGSYNLIALSKYPVIELSDELRFVLNLTAAGRSIFDGVGHTILTAAIEKRLPNPWNHQRAVGSLYGDILEPFVRKILEQAFPKSVHKVPEEREERADFVILFGSSVVVLEVKARHFLGPEHASFMTLDQRRDKLEQTIELPKAISQIAKTIQALRNGDIDVPGLPADWTTTPIIPVIITEERLPQVQGCWEPLYAPMMQPFEDLHGAGPIAPLRLLAIEDLEIVPNVALPDDFGTTCLKWAHDPDLRETNQGRSFRSGQGPQRRIIWLPLHFLSRTATDSSFF